MNWREQHNLDRPEVTEPHTSSHPLDELLRGARWPTATSQQLHRLRKNWLYRSRVPRLVRLALAAAAIVAATGLAIWQYRWSSDESVPEDGPVFRVAEKRSAVETSTARTNTAEGALVPSGSDLALPQQGDVPPLATIEAENTLEYLLIQSAERRRSDSQTHRAAADLQDRIDKAVTSLALRQQTLDELQVDLTTQAADCEQHLVGLIQQSTGAKRRAAIQLLSAIGTQRSLPTLMALAQSAELRKDAIPGIARLASPQLLARLAMMETDVAMQRQLMAALLERNTRESVDLFLNLTADPRTAEQAFAVLPSVNAAPTELLIESLRAPKVSRRLVAARILGGLNDSRITRQLIALAVQGELRREALVALLSSSNPEARRFVASGQRDLVWSAQLKAAGSDAQLPTTQFQEI
jgi:hypothetical protein